MDSLTQQLGQGNCRLCFSVASALLLADRITDSVTLSATEKQRRQFPCPNCRVKESNLKDLDQHSIMANCNTDAGSVSARVAAIVSYSVCNTDMILILVLLPIIRACS